MITHEQAISNLIETDDIDIGFQVKYVRQQEKKDELLGLYQKREINRNLPHPSHADEMIYTRKIKALETELKGE